MRSGLNNLNYFPKNKLTKLANLVQFKRILMSCLNPTIYATAFWPSASHTLRV